MVSPDTETAALGLRERKNRRTKLAIVQATAELTLAEGYAAATIPRIAERADVAPRTVSTWFPSKDDILFEGVDDQVARGVAYLQGEDGDFVDRVLAWFADEESRDRPDRELSRLRRDAIEHDPELRARSRQLLESFQREVARVVARDTGTAVEDMGPQLVAGAAMAFLERLAAMTIEEPTELGSAQVAAGIEFLRAGLASVNPGR
jgi:AcrR family transcriptional regulator